MGNKAKGWTGVLLFLIIVAVGYAFDIGLIDEDGNLTKVETVKVATVADTNNLSILEVHFIDVGQAESILLFEGNKENVMLIDAGDWNRTDVVDYLTELGVKDIDILVGTHPHADHIGQMDKVIEMFNVGEVWMSGDMSTSNVFERVLEAIEKYDVGYYEPRAWETFKLGGMEIEIVGPEKLDADLNNNSIVMKVTYGDVKFLFTGDVEQRGEKTIIERGHDIQADILSMGHHGSGTSSTDIFLNEVKPKVAIYSAGEGNSYGHPEKNVVDRILDRGIDLYGTDKHGNIIIETNGQEFTVFTED